ncbi:MAG: S-layer homology domain-containing protein [Oscillospiraceae bacterium]|nr:S-layer homology domain-containing protein [Oscillospiraceae bacterium]
MKTKLLSLLLALVLIIGLFPVAVWADAGVSEISSVGEFKSMNATGNYKLTADITVTEPYGGYDKQFTGIFDGDGHTVTLSISGSDTYQGLFGYIGISGIVKNVKVIGSVSNTSNMTGGIAGYSKGTIENCSNNASITGMQYTGGIVGQDLGASGNKTSIIGSANSGSVSGTKYVGGIAGKNAYGSIVNTYNTGTVSASTATAARVGGIVGDASSGTGCEIKSSYSTGNVTFTGTGSPTQYGALIGFLDTNYSLSNCYYESTAYNVAVGFNVPKNGVFPIATKTALLSELNLATTNVWAADKNNINNGYPILAWQAKTETVKVPVVSVSIDGTARSGKNLTAQAKGAGDASATGVKFQWQIADSAAGAFTDVYGATGQGFALADEHRGKFLRVSTAGDENSSAVSAAVGPVLMSETDAVAADKASLSGIPSVARLNTALTLPASGTSGSTIMWSSNNADIIKNNGSVTLPETDNATVTLTATISCGGASDTKTFSILVYSQKAVEEESGNASVYLENAVASLQWYKLNPVYGIDTNVCTVLKTALVKNGYGNLSVNIKSATNLDDTASIENNGNIIYFYTDPVDNNSNNPKQVKVLFTLTKDGTSLDYEKNVVINWNADKVNEYLEQEIISELNIPQIVADDFDLPRYITGSNGRKAWVELSYSVSDESAMTVSKEKQTGGSDAFYNPYVAKVKPIAADKTITLTVIASFNRSAIPIILKKTYQITVKSDPETLAALKKDLSAKLESGFAAKGLTDYVTKNKLAETGGVYTALNDIKLPTTKDFGVDGKYYPITLKSSDTDVLVTPDVNNAARVYVYRPLPGKTAKTAILTVSLTDKATGISASKEFEISVSPLTQGEIDAEIALMDLAKAHYFDGIKNGNAIADSVTTDLHAFQEVYLKDGSITWVYDSKELVNHGIVPVAIDGWDTLEQWRTFRSSNAAVISHENLLVTRQTESKAVTVTSYLSSEVYGKYAEKYPENANFRKLYYQPVTASLIVRGTNPISTEPVAEKLNVSFTLQSADSTWISRTNVSGLQEGSTVFDVFTQALRANGYGFSSRGSYVYVITNPDGTSLEELDAGENSGWMYKVNGVTPSSYMSACPLKHGDNIVVFFTKDYTQDVIWSDPGTAESGGNVAPSVTAQNGKAEAAVDSKSITSALSQNNGRVVIAPKITGSAESVSVSIPATSVKEIAGNASGTLSVQSDCGSVSLPNGTLNSVSEQAGDSDIKMTIEAKSAKDVDLPAADLENAAIVEISISSGGKNITTFGGGSLAVSIPVTGSYKTGDSYKVIVISSDGTVETLVGNVVNNNGKASVAVTVKHLSTFVVTKTPIVVFDDVSTNAWYYDAVEYAARNGIMKGVAETAFAPNDEVSRAMLVTVLYRLEGNPAVTDKSAFTDIENGQWYTDPVIWASKNRIVEGYGDGDFGVNDIVTREQLATVLYRYSIYKGLDITKTTSLEKYIDAGTIGDFAQSGITWANAEGLITGASANMLDPKGKVTRAQAATVLMRYCENIKK